MTKNNYWELDPHILGLDTTKIKLFFFDRKKFKFENPNGQNLNLKLCNGQKFKSVTVRFYINLML